MLLKGNPGQTGHLNTLVLLMFIGLLEKMSSCQDFLEKTTPTFRIVPTLLFYLYLSLVYTTCYCPKKCT
jgi:hypothetical protein